MEEGAVWLAGSSWAGFREALTVRALEPMGFLDLDACLGCERRSADFDEVPFRGCRFSCVIVLPFFELWTVHHIDTRSGSIILQARFPQQFIGKGRFLPEHAQRFDDALGAPPIAPQHIL